MYGNEFRPLKRAHSPDAYSSQPPPNFRGGPGGPPGGYRQGGGHPFVKRHRGDGYGQARSIDEKIAQLGDTGFRNADIGALAKDIDYELMNKVTEEEKIRNIASQICKCAISFPTRIGAYATLIGLISVKHYNVSCQIINSLHASYPVYIEAQKWQEALTIIHLLSSLVNCKVIRPSALISQFELLLEIAMEENVPQARSDYYVYTVLSSLPLVALELSVQTDPPNNFETLLASIEGYLNKRSKSHLNVTRVWLSDVFTIQMDYLDSLWVQTKNFRANGWNETFLHRPYNEKDYKDIMSSSLIPQNSPTIQIPAHCDANVYPPPRIVFRLYEDDFSESLLNLPGSDKVERFCIENHIRNLLDEMPNNSRDCARHLNHMHGEDRLPLAPLLIETIIGELMALPKPKHQEIYYHSLLYELSRIFQPSKKPEEIKLNYDVVLNDGVRVLYENLETMNVTCIDRFVSWFAFHLNNTEFLYPWQTWADSTVKDRSSPKAVFVQDVLERSIRLSFHKKISTLVEAHLSPLIPAEAAVEYKCVFADHPKAEELAAVIKKMIVQKAEAADMCETLNLEVANVKMPSDFQIREEKHMDKLLKIDIFTSVILVIASKSLTHLTSAIGKFRNFFKALISIQDGQAQLLRTMHSCLEKHPQLQVILVDKLLKAELIDAREVCRWIFSDCMKAFHLRSYPWELLNNTIRRVEQTVDKLIKEKKELAKAPQAAKEAPKKVSDDDGAGTPTQDGENGEGKEEAPAEVPSEQTPRTEADVDMKQEPDTTVLDAKIEQARKSSDLLILSVFQMFADLLSEHIRNCEASSTSYLDNWFRWVAGRMQQLYYNNYDRLRHNLNEIKSTIDVVPSIGSYIVNLNV